MKNFSFKSSLFLGVLLFQGISWSSSFTALEVDQPSVSGVKRPGDDMEGQHPKKKRKIEKTSQPCFSSIQAKPDVFPPRLFLSSLSGLDYVEALLNLRCVNRANDKWINLVFQDGPDILENTELFSDFPNPGRTPSKGQKFLKIFYNLSKVLGIKTTRPFERFTPEDFIFHAIDLLKFPNDPAAEKGYFKSLILNGIYKPISDMQLYCSFNEGEVIQKRTKNEAALSLFTKDQLENIEKDASPFFKKDEKLEKRFEKISQELEVFFSENSHQIKWRDRAESVTYKILEDHIKSYKIYKIYKEGSPTGVLDDFWATYALFEPLETLKGKAFLSPTKTASFTASQLEFLIYHFWCEWSEKDLKALIDAGNPMAYTFLAAQKYNKQVQVESRLSFPSDEIILLLEKAAEKGCDIAQYYVGRHWLDKGPLYFSQGKKWLQYAANQKNYGAKIALLGLELNSQNFEELNKIALSLESTQRRSKGEPVTFFTLGTNAPMLEEVKRFRNSLNSIRKNSEKTKI